MGINRSEQPKQEMSSSESHLNWMGAPSFDITNPILRLRIAASSCFFGEPQYYHKTGKATPTQHQPGLSEAELAHLRSTLNAIDPQEWRSFSPAQLIEQAIDAALEFDPQAAFAEAVRLRNAENIRVTPQVILVRAANHKALKGTNLVRRFAPEIIKRPDEPAAGLAYQLRAFGKPIPNSLKKSWKKALEGFSESALAKYRLENQDVKTVDVMNLVHPKSVAIEQLAKGHLKTTDQTWESIIAAEGSNAQSWSKALAVMGHMALLRNLRNLLEHGINSNLFLDKLEAGAVSGKQLPFRYYSAYKAVEALTSPSTATTKLQQNNSADLQAIDPTLVLESIERCLQQSMGNLPRFKGRVMSLCDNSGSAQRTTTSSMGKVQISEIANLSAILTAQRADEGWVGVFGNRLKTFAIAPDASVFEQTRYANRVGRSIGEETENGIWLFWNHAIRQCEHWDMIFVYSDMQAGHGRLFGAEPNQYKNYIWNPKDQTTGHYIDVPKLISTYRQAVNPNVLVFLVQVAGYQDTIVPEFYDRTYILGCWGDGLLQFAAKMASLL